MISIGERLAPVTGRLAPWLWPLAVANLVANIGIVVTGGAVRLTGSGLGCPTWPTCTGTDIHPPLELHGVIEFGNRLLTFVLAAVAVLTFLAALGAGHRRVLRLAFVVGLSIPAQAMLGGVTVLTDLNPWVVALHFLVSMAIIMCCVALIDELRSPDRGPAPALHRGLAAATWLVGWVVLHLGTTVTGAGPHAGDENSPRNGVDPLVATQVHAASAYVLTALTLALLTVALRTGHGWLARVTGLVLLLEVAQGVLGWVQHALDLPVLLVALHMLGAALLAAGLARIGLAVLPHRAALEADTGSGAQWRPATVLSGQSDLRRD